MASKQTTLRITIAGDNRHALAAPVERDGIPHNLIAHPLLILCPPVGRWLHDHTEPTVTRGHIVAALGERIIPAASVRLP